jgi:hypothetical protein
MSENFKIHLQGTSDTKQWIAAQGVLTKLESSADKFIESLRMGVGIDLGGKLVNSLQRLPDIFIGAVKSGVDFNVALHDSEIAIGNVLQKFGSLSAEAAKQEAAKAMAKIIELEPKVAGTLQDLTGGLLSTVASAQAAGIGIEQNIELVGMFANALANANIPAEQLTQELRAIFTGNITPDAALGKLLNISNADVKNAKEAGTLYSLLKDRVGTLGVAGDTAAVAFSTLGSAVSKAQGLLAKPVFDLMIQGAKDLSQSLNDPAIIASLQQMGVKIGSVVKEGIKLTEWAVRNGPALMTVAESAVRVGAALAGLKLASIVTGLMSMTARWIGATAAITANTAALARNAAVATTAAVAGMGAGAGAGVGAGGAAAAGAAGAAGAGLGTKLAGGVSKFFGYALAIGLAVEARRVLVELGESWVESKLPGDSGVKIHRPGPEDKSPEGAVLGPAEATAADLTAQQEQLAAELEKMEGAQRLEWARNVEGAELAIAQARAAGHEDLARQYEDSQKIIELAKRYREELQLGGDEALSKATQLVRLQRSISNASDRAPETESVAETRTPNDALIEAAQQSRRRSRGDRSSMGSPWTLDGTPLFEKINRLKTPVADASPQIMPSSNSGVASSAVKGTGSGATSSVNLGENKAAVAAKEATAGMARVVNAVSQRDAATASEINKLKNQIAVLERKIGDVGRQGAGNR